MQAVGNDKAPGRHGFSIKITRAWQELRVLVHPPPVYLPTRSATVGEKTASQLWPWPMVHGPA